MSTKMSLPAVRFCSSAFSLSISAPLRPMMIPGRAVLMMMRSLLPGRSIEIERPGNKLRIIIKTARPGIIIGRKGAEIDKLKAELQKRTAGKDIFVDIQEVHKPELDAQLVSESIALQLEKRVGFRRAMRKAVDSALRFGCKGIKVRVSGRLNGNEIARSEWYLQGRLPLHTLRADIEYGFSEAKTTYGVIGVKCWIYRGEILPQKKREGQPPVGTGAF